MNSNYQCLTHTRALSLPGRALAQLEASAKRAGTNDRVMEQSWSVHDKAAQPQTAELHVRPLGCSAISVRAGEDWGGLSECVCDV